MNKVYKVTTASKYGKLSKLFSSYDEAAEQYNTWVDNFDLDKADGEPVLRVSLNVFENGAETTLAIHF